MCEQSVCGNGRQPGPNLENVQDSTVLGAKWERYKGAVPLRLWLALAHAACNGLDRSPSGSVARARQWRRRFGHPSATSASHGRAGDRRFSCSIRMRRTSSMVIGLAWVEWPEWLTISSDCTPSR